MIYRFKYDFSPNFIHRTNNTSSVQISGFTSSSCKIPTHIMASKDKYCKAYLQDTSAWHNLLNKITLYNLPESKQQRNMTFT